MPAEPIIPARRFLTIQETAEILCVTTRSVRLWIADGSLPAQRLHGKAIRINPADLRSLLRPIPAGGGNDAA